MTIIELIEKLAEFPPDMRVVAHDGEYVDFWDIKDIYVVDTGHVSDGPPNPKALKLSPFDDGLNR